MADGATVVHGREMDASGEEPNVLDLMDLYRDHERRIHRICLRLLRNTADAEDATQETFIRASRHLGDGLKNPGAYLTTIAVSVCRDEMRRRMRGHNAIAGLEADPAPQPRDAEHQALDRFTIRRVWRDLSDRDRALFTYRFLGYSHDEIASELGMQSGSTAVALARLRGRVRQHAGYGWAVAGIPAFLLRRVAQIRSRLWDMRPQPTGTASHAVQGTALVTGCLITSCLLAGSGPAAAAHATGPAPAVAMAGGGARAIDGAPRGGGVADTGARPASDSGRLVPSIPHVPAAAPRVPNQGSIVSDLVDPGQNARQEDAGFQDLVPSPHYAQDHTIFALGSLVNHCGRVAPGACPVLFRSTDGGATWTHVAGNGLVPGGNVNGVAGHVILPPAYPADPTIYVKTPTQLLRSDDGGADFTVAVTLDGPAVAVPGSAAQDAHILIGSDPMVIYSEMTRTVAPGPSLPETAGPPTDVAFAGSRLLVSSNSYDALGPLGLTGVGDGVVFGCNPGRACQELVREHGATFHLVVSTGFDADQTVVAYSTNDLWISHDGAHTFRLSGGADLAQISVVAAGPAAPRMPDLTVGETTSRGMTDLESTNGGRTLQPFAASLPAAGQFQAMLLLPGNRLLVALAAADNGVDTGIRCSTDGGATWRHGC